jgi:coenzyme F420 hydrogenase subunit beta
LSNPLLNILSADPIPLKKGSFFYRKNEWPPEESKELPRALNALSRIVDGGLCHRCGSCVGICPTKVLGVDDTEYPIVKNLSACTDCDLCIKVCPGDNFDVDTFSEMHYKEKKALEDTHGHFIEGIIAYSNNKYIREHSTSGGLVTALLLDLMESGDIDGAVTIISDDKDLWRGKPIIARSKEELLLSMKSKYAISPTNSVFSEILEKEGKYALVGLPCQIHGFVKAAELDARLKERIVLTIGLFCHAAIEHDAYKVIWGVLGDKVKNAKRFISRIGKHPGTPYVELESGELIPVYYGNINGYRPTSIEMINILYRLYTPQRCLTCFDATAEFADIAVGDPWMAPPEDDVDFYQGWSFALVRTERAYRLFEKLLHESKVTAVKLTQSETLACNRLMATEKRWRAFRVIETLRRQGKPIPDYGVTIPKHNPSHFIKTELHMFTHIFCNLPGLRDGFLKFMLSKKGYSLLWLNNQRRKFRFFRRDMISKLRRKYFGRR